MSSVMEETVLNGMLSGESNYEARLCRIGDVVEKITGGCSTKKTDYIGGGVLVLNKGHIKAYGIVDLGDQERFVSEKYANENQSRVVQNDTVLVTLRDLSVKADFLGLIGTYRKNQDALITQGMYALDLGKEIYAPYLVYYSNSPGYRAYVKQNKIGSTQVHLRNGQFLDIKIPLPPLEQQKHIVAKIEELFSHIDAGIEAVKKAKQLLKQYRQSVLKAAVTGELTKEWREANKDKLEPASQLLERILEERRRKWEEQQTEKFNVKGRLPKSDSWKKKYKERLVPEWPDLDELPDGWSWITIDQLASDESRSIQSGPFGSNLKHSEFQETGRLVVGIDNVREGFFSMGSENRISDRKYEELKKYAARPGDVLITVMATIGRTCVIPIDLEPAIITKHVYRITADRDLVLPDYLNMCLCGAQSVLDQIFSQTIGQTRPGLNGTIIKGLCIPIPSTEEQELVIEEVNKEFDVVNRLSSQLAMIDRKSKKSKQSILASAFLGSLLS